MNPVTQRPKAKFSTPARENTVWWLGIIGAVAVMLLYLPTFRAGFIWDDDVMLTDNPLVKGGWRGLLNIWCSTKLVDYFPLTSTSLWLEWHLWGTSPAGYHVTNIVLHAIS
ncbi:MAG: hypothetical protein ACXWC8_15220, partial [Limisphaerales bacterium]